MKTILILLATSIFAHAGIGQGNGILSTRSISRGKTQKIEVVVQVPKDKAAKLIVTWCLEAGSFGRERVLTVDLKAGSGTYKRQMNVLKKWTAQVLVDGEVIDTESNLKKTGMFRN